jgi:hypothetical protein
MCIYLCIFMNNIILDRLSMNIDNRIMNFINKEASGKKQTKRYIVESALKMYEQSVLQENIEKGYINMMNDTDDIKEWLDIANNNQNL